MCDHKIVLAIYTDSTHRKVSHYRCVACGEKRESPFGGSVILSEEFGKTEGYILNDCYANSSFTRNGFIIRVTLHARDGRFDVCVFKDDKARTTVKDLGNRNTIINLPEVLNKALEITKERWENENSIIYR